MKPLKSRKVGEAWVVELEGSVDAQSAPELKAAMQVHAGNGGAKLVVNLQGVEYMDSSGLGMLLSTLKRVRYEGGDVRIFGVRGQVEELFKLTRMDRIFDIRDDEADALTGI